METSDPRVETPVAITYPGQDGVMLTSGETTLKIAQLSAGAQPTMTGLSMRANRRCEDSVACGSEDFDAFVARLHEGAERATLGVLDHEQLIATASPGDTLNLQFHGPQQRFTLTGVDRETFIRSLVPLMAAPRSHGLGRSIPAA